jgi:superfamily I DNA and RNA helicase
MKFVPTLHTFDTDVPAKTVWGRIETKLADIDGVGLYKHPNLAITSSNKRPDLVVLPHGYSPLVVVVVRFGIDELGAIEDEVWQVNGTRVESPVLDAEDFVANLDATFARERRLRTLFKSTGVVALPQISKAQFVQKFGEPDRGVLWLWRDEESDDPFPKLSAAVGEDEWRLARSVLQAATPLNKGVGPPPERLDKKGPAIRQIERSIALLDDEQEKVALQIPPGPQQIRGLAGTGKTVLLAMKAANIHSHYREARILFTFNTQSLYNQTRLLITKFYRYHNLTDPDWDRLHVRHAWGSSRRPGVYSDLCARQGLKPLALQEARLRNRRMPLQACCRDALRHPVEPFYDYILVDEAQDFPPEFLQILYKLTPEPHRIYFAYDELQTLSSVEAPSPATFFGTDEHGKPLVSLDGIYPGPMEKDLILRKSYRCPLEVLMFAHAIGLGIHGPRGCVQMLPDASSWKAIGYEIESGELRKGEPVTIYRPPENSPNRIDDIYSGSDRLIRTNTFASREAELDWVADSVAKDIQDDEVSPEQIVVISLDSLKAKELMLPLQHKLRAKGISSTIPGLLDDTSEFAESGKVTLSTVHRAKGNEAPIIYIIGFESLYDYVGEIDLRNRAFTCISRAKAWVRISGISPKMEKVQPEFDAILRDLPRFKFNFPDVEQIRRLGVGETTRRRMQVKEAKESVQSLRTIDPDALSALDPAELDLLEQKIKEAREAKV